MKLRAITENHLFVKSYSKGKRCVCANVAVYVLRDLRAEKLRRANPAGAYLNRVGISAGKKIGGAVARNRAKRVIREAYRAVDRKYAVKTGFLVVLAAREGAVKVKTAEVERDLRYAFNRLDMLARR